MRARFIGDPAHGGEGPALLSFRGVDFVKDDWVEDIPAPVAAKLIGNSHFECDDVLSDEEIDSFVAPVIAAAADEPVTPPDLDDDGKPGGSVPADDIAVEKAQLIADIVALGGAKPHHMTGLPRLREQLEALPAPSGD